MKEFKPIRTAADLPPIGTPAGEQLKFQDPDLLVDDEGHVVGTRQVPVPPQLPILARLNLLEERLEALEKENWPPDPDPVLREGAFYTRAECEHCGRFSTVDIGERLSACLLAFRGARELAITLRENGLLDAADAGGAIARVLFEAATGQPETT